MYETQEPVQHALLIGVDTGAFDAQASIDELAELAQAAGAEVEGTLLQTRPQIDNATYIGSGKLEEVKQFCQAHDVDLLIFDDELTGSQIRNLEEKTGRDVIDRTTLILDIFAKRARSNEGKLQVELAQQKYLLPRLIGAGRKLSRLGGGIGTRGPGESKLESDRRHIHRRISALEEQLEELSRQRARARASRAKRDYTTVAIVGYTNVGKSTLLNKLTDAGVLAKDQLFATLDPTARELLLPDGRRTILVDTVGLINRLPHQLVQAFHSTLEEAAESDLILNICDASSDRVEEQLAVTRDLLDQLGCGDIPMLTVYNKTDLLGFCPDQPANDKSVFISAKEGVGLELLLQKIAKNLFAGVKEVELCVPYEKGALLNSVRQRGKVLAEDFTEEGVLLRLLADQRLQNEMADYMR